jgi:hypothetical protein
LADYQIESNLLTEFNLMSPTTTAHDAIYPTLRVSLLMASSPAPEPPKMATKEVFPSLESIQMSLASFLPQTAMASELSILGS